MSAPASPTAPGSPFRPTKIPLERASSFSLTTSSKPDRNVGSSGMRTLRRSNSHHVADPTINKGGALNRYSTKSEQPRSKPNSPRSSPRASPVMGTRHPAKSPLASPRASPKASPRGSPTRGPDQRPVEENGDGNQDNGTTAPDKVGEASSDGQIGMMMDRRAQILASEGRNPRTRKGHSRSQSMVKFKDMRQIAESVSDLLTLDKVSRAQDNDMDDDDLQNLAKTTGLGRVSNVLKGLHSRATATLGKMKSIQNEQIKDILGKPPTDRTVTDLAVLNEKSKPLKFFADLDKDTRLELCKVMSCFECKEDTLVYSNGDPGTHFYVVMSGLVTMHDPEQEKRLEDRLDSTESLDFTAEPKQSRLHRRMRSGTVVAPRGIHGPLSQSMHTRTHSGFTKSMLASPSPSRAAPQRSGSPAFGRSMSPQPTPNTDRRKSLAPRAPRRGSSAFLTPGDMGVTPLSATDRQMSRRESNVSLQIGTPGTSRRRGRAGTVHHSASPAMSRRDSNQSIGSGAGGSIHEHQSPMQIRKTDSGIDLESLATKLTSAMDLLKHSGSTAHDIVSRQAHKPTISIAEKSLLKASTPGPRARRARAKTTMAPSPLGKSLPPGGAPLFQAPSFLQNNTEEVAFVKEKTIPKSTPDLEVPPGGSFGHLALMNDEAYKQTAVARGRTILLVLAKDEYNRILKEVHLKAKEEKDKFLLKIAPLSGLYTDHSIISGLNQVLKPTVLPKNAVLMKQGAEFDGVVFIRRGCCTISMQSKITKDNRHARTPHRTVSRHSIDIATLVAGEYIGEHGLMNDAKGTQPVTVTAQTEIEFFLLSKKDFFRIVRLRVIRKAFYDNGLRKLQHWEDRFAHMRQVAMDGGIPQKRTSSQAKAVLASDGSGINGTGSKNPRAPTPDVPVYGYCSVPVVSPRISVVMGGPREESHKLARVQQSDASRPPRPKTAPNRADKTGARRAESLSKPGRTQDSGHQANLTYINRRDALVESARKRKSGLGDFSDLSSTKKGRPPTARAFASTYRVRIGDRPPIRPKSPPKTKVGEVPKFLHRYKRKADKFQLFDPFDASKFDTDSFTGTTSKRSRRRRVRRSHD